MKRRRSILFDPDVDRQLQRRARERGTTFTDEVRIAVERYLGEEPENPNQWLIDSIGVVDSGGKFPPVDSDAGRELLRELLQGRRTARERG